MDKDIIEYFENSLLSADFDCNIFFGALNKKFSKEEILRLFEYIFFVKQNDNILDKAIRYINSSKTGILLSVLIDFIVKPAEEKKLNLKVLAIKTISNFKDKSAVPSLLFCLNDKNSNYKIRLAAAEALGKIGDKIAFESLGGIVCDEQEKSVYVKESAVAALGMLGDNRALDVFNSIINTKQMFLDKFSYLKERMIEAMAKLDISKDKKALEILKNSLMDSSENVRISTIETIMNSDIESGYELIYERLKFDDSLEVKKNALIALYNISDKRILEEVILGNYDNKLKDYAKEIMNEYEENHV